MSLTRRSLLSAMVYGGLSYSFPMLARAEGLGVRATQVLQARPATGRREPPVVTCLAVQQEGDLIAVGGDDHLLRVWNIRTGKLVHELAGHNDWIRAVQFVPGTKDIITAGSDRRLLRWTLTDGGVAHRELAQHEQAIACVSLSSDGTRLAATGFEPRMSLYDLASPGEASHIACPCRDMRAATFSPDGQHLAAGGRNGKLRLWSMNGQEHAYDTEAHTQRIRALAFSPDGRHLVSASEDRTARIWNVATGEPETLLTTGTAKILSTVYLDDRHVATGGSDNVIRVWNIETRDEVATLIGHTGSVAALVSRDGMLISGSFDTTVRIWHPLAANVGADRRFDGKETLK